MAQRKPNHNKDLLKKLKKDFKIDEENDNSKKSDLYAELTAKYNELMGVKDTEFQFHKEAIRKHFNYLKDKESGKR